jgi:hypothetical protein
MFWENRFTAARLRDKIVKLPVTDQYLAKALIDGAQVGETVLSHRRIADVLLPSGKLVACDPVVFPDAEPFDLLFPKGSFPVIASVAMLGADQRVAFATVRFRETTPVAWDLLTLDGQDTSTLKPGQFFGYPIDAGTGSFMDERGARVLRQLVKENPDFYEVLIAEFEKHSVRTWDWLDYKLGNGEQNLVAFTSGFGDGFFATYAGFDADSEISVVVTDFGVVELK